jgi:hypothetical protein
MFKYLTQYGVQPIQAASWRCQCMIIFLAPIAIIEAAIKPSNRVDWFARKEDLKFPVIVHVIIAGKFLI